MNRFMNRLVLPFIYLLICHASNLQADVVEPLKLSYCANIVSKPEGLLFTGTSPLQHVTGYQVDIREDSFFVPCEVDLGPFSFTLARSQYDASDLTDALIKITPIVQADEGVPFYFLYKSSLPMPTQAEVDLVGGGEVIPVGSHIFSILKEFGGLRDTDVVLDIGCGCGRAAYPLTSYLKPSTVYIGFDIMPNLITRAQKSISRYHPQFYFQLLNLYNSVYNPKGTMLSKDLRFPYDDNSFDFVFLTSVFTHMFSSDIKHYMDEIKRVLKPGGKCMLTAFLRDDMATHCMALGKSKIAFPFAYGDCLVNSLKYPEGAVSFPQSLFWSWILERGFSFEGIFPGEWSGRPDSTISFQDFVLIKKAL